MLLFKIYVSFFLNLIKIVELKIIAICCVNEKEVTNQAFTYHLTRKNLKFQRPNKNQNY
jgi:energy-converting hydrogenase Eha subunit H